MAFLPLLLRDALEPPRRPSLFDQHFGLGLLEDDLLNHAFPTVPYCSGYIRPWRRQPSQRSGVSNIENTKDAFKVNLDVQQFKAEEIAVKVVDNYVVVEGKHEEREDEHGFISRNFQRRYLLPESVDPDTVVSKLSSDGILTIEAPKKVLSAPGNERVISITHTNEPAVSRSKQVSKNENPEAK